MDSTDQGSNTRKSETDGQQQNENNEEHNVNKASSHTQSLNDLVDELLDDQTIDAKDEPIEVESDSNFMNAPEDPTENQNEVIEESTSILRIVDETVLESPKKKRTESRSPKKLPRKHDPPKSMSNDVTVCDEDGLEYKKPPMSPELLIAIAVRNLDPHKDAGASCTDIVGFLSIHFPYFSDNFEECKVSYILMKIGEKSNLDDAGNGSSRMRHELKF